MLATGDEANKTTIYDLKSKTKIHEWDHKAYVNSVCFSPDGSMLATGDGSDEKESGKTTIYDLKTKTKIYEWDHKGFVNSVCFSPDGLCLQRVRVQYDQEKQLFITSKPKRKENNEFQKQDKDTRDHTYTAYVFLARRFMLATGDEANKTTIYDLKSKTKIHEWDHKDPVNSVCFSPDGLMLATGD